LQIENHVYCDTSLIARVLEALVPEPTLVPHAARAGGRGVVRRPVFEAVMPFVARPTRFDEAMRLLQPEELAGSARIALPCTRARAAAA